MNIDKICNFAIIAHIDHGKSTLADRFLELTKTVEKRKMREQYLDQMELERERGITIKMQPVRMKYTLNTKLYTLNLIDTPGHIDFSYEVSRSLKAVEGVVLLVDATQGVQAQTVGNLEMARSLGLLIIPVINKIDSQYARIEETEKEIVEILRCQEDDILKISAKTGDGVKNLLEEIINRIPSPPMNEVESHSFRALVFDFEYSLHRGVILYVRITDGEIKKGDNVFLHQAKVGFSVAEVGVFIPNPQPTECLKQGEIGRVVTNVKKADMARVGDTLVSKTDSLSPLEGYKKPSPVVWASIYPESQNDFMVLKQSLGRLNLSDSALSFSSEGGSAPGGEEVGPLGRGFRCGFLGMLHLEIVIERLKREFGLKLVTTAPSVFCRSSDLSTEPWAEINIIISLDKLNSVISLLKKREAIIGETSDFGSNRLLIKSEIALREMMDNFFEDLKSVTAGYASFDYKIIENRSADLIQLNILLNQEIVPAFAKIVKRSDAQRSAVKIADKLKKFLPRALFVIKIQVSGMGRILAARSISALRKDVTKGLYGGDVTRKMKVLKKQKRGKEKLKQFGKVHVPHEVFLKMIR
ncbi:elongation factor 4 [Patescibacteria group bacterium]